MKLTTIEKIIIVFILACLAILSYSIPKTIELLYHWEVSNDKKTTT